MKKNVYILVIFIVLLVTGCSNIGTEKAEFDGGYVLASDDSFVALEEKKNYRTQVVRGGMSISQVMRSPKKYYVIDNSTKVVLSSNDIQGVYIKGNYKYKNFSLHYLEKKQLKEGEGLFENKGPATKNKPFYFAGKQIEIQSKKDENANGYYFILKDKLQSGQYVAWINNKFWIFGVK